MAGTADRPTSSRAAKSPLIPNLTGKRQSSQAGRAGPRATAALIAADEVAVARFLDGTLSFPGIWRLAEAAVDLVAVHQYFSNCGLSEPRVPDVVHRHR